MGMNSTDHPRISNTNPDLHVGSLVKLIDGPEGRFYMALRLLAGGDREIVTCWDGALAKEVNYSARALVVDER
jgi:hypothetical protein